jgi:hypothetical protein
MLDLHLVLVRGAPLIDLLMTVSSELVVTAQMQFQFFHSRREGEDQLFQFAELFVSHVSRIALEMQLGEM